MIALEYDNLTQRCDFMRTDGFSLDTDEGLETAITVSFFTDARATEEDGLDPAQDPRGWWGAAYLNIQPGSLGSKLWMLRRMKLTNDTLLLASSWARESILWLLPRTAQTIVCTTERMAGINNAGLITTQIQKPSKTAPRFEAKWKVQIGI